MKNKKYISGKFVEVSGGEGKLEKRLVCMQFQKVGFDRNF